MTEWSLIIQMRKFNEQKHPELLVTINFWMHQKITVQLNNI